MAQHEITAGLVGVIYVDGYDIMLKQPVMPANYKRTPINRHPTHGYMPVGWTRRRNTAITTVPTIPIVRKEDLKPPQRLILLRSIFFLAASGLLVAIAILVFF